MTTPETQEQTPPNRNGLVLFASLAIAGMVMASMMLLAETNNRPSTIETTRAAVVAQGSANVTSGWRVPNFELTALNGETVSFSEYRGKIVLLNFWATWCVPCQREMPAFNDFMANPPEDVVILAINNGENRQVIQEYLDLYNLDHIPVFMDETYEIADAFGIFNMPVTYIITPDGIVQTFKLGEMTQADIDAYISQIRAL